jgi:hypothetical protein
MACVINESNKMYSTGAHLPSGCVVCNFTYIIGLHIYVFQIHAGGFKTGYTTDTLCIELKEI